MTLTQETAEKCEKALRMVEWSGMKAKKRTTINPSAWVSCCPLCSQGSDDAHKQYCPIRTTLAALRDDMAEQPQPITPEQQARDMLQRMTDASSSVRSVAELTDLIASHERLLAAVAAAVGDTSVSEWWEYYGKDAIDNAWKPN